MRKKSNGGSASISWPSSRFSLSSRLEYRQVVGASQGPSVCVRCGWTIVVSPYLRRYVYGSRATTSSLRRTTAALHRPGATLSSHHGCSKTELTHRIESLRGS